MIRRGFHVLLLVGLAVAAQGVLADAKSARTVRIIGRTSATVTTSMITLAEVADISSSENADDEAIIALQKIKIMDAPAPGREVQIEAATILDRMRAEGVDLKKLGYRFPRTIKVTRASRTLTALEVRTAIESYLIATKRDVALQSIDYKERIQIAPGMTEIETKGADSDRAGEMTFNVIATVADAAPVQFTVRGKLNEWREVPVAARPVARGSVVGDSDMRMARLNINDIPKDAAVDRHTIIGLKTSNDIGFGETFRRNKLAISPTISDGSTVTLVYRTSLLEATATGTALESGVIGQEIKVRNETSKKVVTGTVTETGIVKVN